MTFKKGEKVMILDLHETTDGEGVYMNPVTPSASKVLTEQMVLIIDNSRLVDYDSYVEKQRKQWYERN